MKVRRDPADPSLTEPQPQHGKLGHVVSYPFFASAVRCEVVNRDSDALSLLQFPENVDQQLEVEGIRVVEVVLVLGCELLLLFIQHLAQKHTFERQC